VYKIAANTANFANSFCFMIPITRKQTKTSYYSIFNELAYKDYKLKTN